MVRITNDVVTDMIESGMYVLGVNPWAANPALRHALSAIGKKPKSSMIIRKTPPWAKSRLYKAAFSEKHIEVHRAFAEASKEASQFVRSYKEKNKTKTAPVHERIKTFREAMARAYRG